MSESERLRNQRTLIDMALLATVNLDRGIEGAVELIKALLTESDESCKEIWERTSIAQS